MHASREDLQAMKNRMVELDDKLPQSQNTWEVWENHCCDTSKWTDAESFKVFFLTTIAFQTMIVTISVSVKSLGRPTFLSTGYPTSSSIQQYKSTIWWVHKKSMVYMVSLISTNYTALFLHSNPQLSQILNLWIHGFTDWQICCDMLYLWQLKICSLRVEKLSLEERL